MLLDQVPATEEERTNAWGELFEYHVWYVTNSTSGSKFHDVISEEDILKRVIAIRKRNRGLPSSDSMPYSEKSRLSSNILELRKYPLLPTDCHPVPEIILKNRRGGSTYGFRKKDKI